MNQTIRCKSLLSIVLLVFCWIVATSSEVDAQRGRPVLNAARTTFVADNGQPLRGPYTSSEWGDPAPYAQIANMKNLGFNAVHIYAECFDINYPNAGSTAPGYSAARIDSVVQATRDLGLYLVMTIGNGANNGNNNYQYAIDFWKFYAQRYANETHVMFEIQNEPMAWGPSYLTGTSPAGVMTMEIDAYRAIRQYAPDTPVLLFSYAVLGGEGGTTAALTDIHAFNQEIFGSQNAVWTNIAVGFHGYAGAGGTATAVAGLIAAGYPCMMTEFGAGTWGGGLGGLDVEGVANWERLGVSWLAFTYIPPAGVSDDVTRPDAYINRVINSGLSWTPDYGTFPVIRSVFDNGGYPWTTAGYYNNLLSGTLRIEAENFDNGGKNVAYYNTNTTNPGGQYRTDQTVGIETTSDAGGGYDLGWIAAGDWLEYTIKVSSAGMYNLRLRVAGTGAGRVQVLAYANNNNQTTSGVDLAGQWTLPNTGDYQTWQTVTKSVFLAPDQQRLRIHVLAAGFNLNWIELSPASAGPLANGTYKFLNAASAQALNLNTDNTVITATASSSNTQQWIIRHIGGGQYQVSPVAGGNSWDSGGTLHLSPWGWGPGGSSCFIMLPTVGSYYRVVPAGSGCPLEPSVDSPPAVENENIYTGAASQQWAIVSPSTPIFPIGLSATAVSTSQVGLTWNAVTNATSYNVKRSPNSGGPYTTIATGVTSTNYTDTVVVGTKYYYVVSAIVGGIESPNSMEATVGLPSPWMSQDIGSVNYAGSVSIGNGVFTVAGSGSDIWGTADAFRFAYVPVTGNCTIIARVASVQNTDGWAKAGLMIRESLNADSANAFIAVTPGNGVTWQTRSSTGGNTGNNNTTGLNAPYWVKLERSGNTFTASRSLDGTNWTQQGNATFTMASAVYIGLAVTSHNNSSLCKATFDNVTAPGWSIPAPPAAPASLTATAQNGQVSLTWATSSNATCYSLKRATTSGGPYAILDYLTTTNYNDTSLVDGTTYYYVVSALNQGGESANSTQASATAQVFIPSGLSATSIFANQIDLSWNACTNATGYNVKRSTTSGGSYTTIATNITTTSYSDTDVVAATTYYYVVSAWVGGTENPDSDQVAATPKTLRAYLKFDETSGTTASDASGNGWAGTLVNGPLWVTGKYTNAVVLDGSDDYVSLPTGVVDGLTSFTISAWVNLDTISTWSRLFDFGTGTTVNMFLTPQSGSGAVRFAMTTNGGGSEQQINGSAALPSGAWTHVAITLSGSTGILYVNGQEVGRNGSMSLTGDSLGATTQNYIGKSQYPDAYLDGRVDDFRIYADALSASDIAFLYAYNPDSAPATPTGLTAASISSSQIDLAWNASSGATSYNVKRSTTSGGPYTTIAGPTATSCSDTGLSAGTTYYYVVSAVNSGGESADSSQVSATTQSCSPTTITPYTQIDGGNWVQTANVTVNVGQQVIFGPQPASGGSWSWSGPNGFSAATREITLSNIQTSQAGTYTAIYTNDCGAQSQQAHIVTVNSAAAPTFVAAGSVTSGTGTITPARPSGIVTGDILLLFVETANQAVSISNSNGGTWAAVTNSPQGTGTAAASTATRLTVFWSRYNGTQGAPTVSDSGDHQLGRMIAIRGAAASGNPWDVTVGGIEATADTSGSIAGATTTVANTLVVTAIATSLPDSTSTTRFSAWTNANLTSLTERTDNSVTAGNGGGLGIATGVKATAGTYGNTAVTLASSAAKGMISIAIKN